MEPKSVTRYDKVKEHRDAKERGACTNISLSNAVEEILWAKDLELYQQDVEQAADIHNIKACCGMSIDSKGSKYETVTVEYGPNLRQFKTAGLTSEKISSMALEWWLKEGRFPDIR